MFEAFQLEFVQRGMLEVVVLSLGAGLIGTWVVLRGLAFFSHAVGTAAFPGLVLADGLAFSAHAGALGTAGLLAAALAVLARRDREHYDSLTALLLVAALAIGVILASDVFHSGSNIETLLFGSLLAISHGDIAWAAGTSVAVLLATLALGPRWLALGFDPGSARALGIRGGGHDVVLFALVALVAIAALTAVGALLATALIVVPAATTRLLFSRMVPWQIATVAVTALEGVVGLWVSFELNAPPGAAIAVLAGGVFATVAVARAATGALRRPRRALAAATALALAALVAGCGSSGDAKPGQLAVVATTTQLGDIVRNVGGDAVSVTQILSANSDPHDYEPRPSDVRDTAGAKLVFTSGNNLDAWMGQVVEQAGGSPRTIVIAPDHTPYRIAGEHGGAEASRFDPHWWHDPRNVEAIVPLIRDALTKADPGARASYDRNATAYLRKLRALDRGIAACVATVPPARRKLVTDHDAFGSFAKRYGIRVIGAVIPSQTTQAQASAKAVAKLARLIEAEHVAAVFPETSVNAKLARAIARDTGATARHALYGDTLGPAGSDGATYLAMERHNADAMVRGFTEGRRACAIRGL